MMQSVSQTELVWVDVENPSRDDLDKLARDHPFHHLNLDDCLSVRQLPKIDEHEDHVFVLLHIPEYDQGNKLVRKSQVSIFLGKDYVVTLHGSESASLRKLFRDCVEMDTVRAANMQSSGRLVYHILDVLVDSMFPTLDKLQESLEGIEDRVFDQRVSVVVELSRLRRVIADMRRIVSPLRRLLTDLSTKVQGYTPENLSKYYGDVHDHVEKVWEVLEQDEETIEIFKDTDFVLSTELTSKVLGILTVVFTLTIPATVVGAIYGMNVPLPGGIQTGPLTFFGTFTTFIVLMGVSLIAAVAMVLWFRREGWF